MYAKQYGQLVKKLTELLRLFSHHKSSALAAIKLHTMNTFFSLVVNDKVGLLTDEEHHHCKNVLRLGVGDKVRVINGKGVEYMGEITHQAKNETHVSIHTYNKVKNEIHLNVAVAPPKSGERLEWMIEKLTEIGVEKIVFIKTQRSERKHVNWERCHKIALSAVKQSQRVWLPQLHEVNSLAQFFEAHQSINGYFGYLPPQGTLPLFSELLLQNRPTNESDVWFLVGPEGDFTPDEVNLCLHNRAIGASLGKYVLRTETATLAAAIMFETCKNQY